MSYCITIREHGCPVVDESDWLMLPAEAGTMVKELCGVYPSQWNGKSAAEMIPVLDAAMKLAQANSAELRQYEGVSFTVETVFDFLMRFHRFCIDHAEYGAVEVDTG